MRIDSSGASTNGQRTERRGRPTQADIARVAGVSQATVSLAISGGAGALRVAPETQQRIRAAIKELGYVVNPAARSLARGSNSILGVYTFESVFPVQDRDFYHPFLLGIEEEAGSSGYDMLLFTSAAGPDGRRSIFAGGVNRLGLADGCVLLGRNGNKDELARLADENYPFVYIGRRDLPNRSLSYVTADYAAATTDVVHRLVKLGHRHVAYLGTDRAEEPDLDRRRGFEAGLAASHVSSQEPLRTSLHDVNTDVLKRIVDSGATALLVEDPEMAEAVFAAADSAGIDVPAQLSIAVLGDAPSARSIGVTTRSWSGFRLPREEMGRQAVRLLLEVLESQDSVAANRVLSCLAVEGESVAPPSDRSHPQKNPGATRRNKPASSD